MSWFTTGCEDVFGKEFFSFSILRSLHFRVLSALFVVLVLCAVAFLWTYRVSLSSYTLAFLSVVIFVRTLNTMAAAVMRHRNLRRIYFPTYPSNTFSGNNANAALGVAARAILDDLFYTFSTLAALLFVVWLSLHRS